MLPLSTIHCSPGLPFRFENCFGHDLLLHGELCVCDIQYVLRASQPNVSRHLSYLKNSGLVLDRCDGSRIFYRLAAPLERNKKRLFDFFQDASKGEKQLRSDKKRLKEAVATGACTLSEWKPFSAVIETKALQAERTRMG